MDGIEERAKEIASKVTKSESLLCAFFYNTIRDACIEMATDQRKIDIDKACKWIEENARGFRLTYKDISDFKKAMED